MKKLRTRGLAATAFLCLLLSSCTNDKPTPSGQPLPAADAEFRSVYRYPLEGPSEINGEATILTASAVADNKEAIRPVLDRILADVRRQQLSPSPIVSHWETMPDFDDGYALGVLAAVQQTDGYTPGDLLQGFEVDYAATVREGRTHWEAKALRIVYIDSQERHPDKNMFELSKEQLASYRLGAQNDGHALMAFLDQHTLGGYPIYIESVVDSFGLRTHAEALYFHDLMEAGQVDKLFNQGPS